MREKVEEVKFPVHEDENLYGTGRPRFEDVGKEMIFLNFPMRTNVVRYNSDPWIPPFQTWSEDIPKMVIERINCYLDAFKSLIQYNSHQFGKLFNQLCIESSFTKLILNPFSAVLSLL
jgi:hypothetical protein